MPCAAPAPPTHRPAPNAGVAPAASPPASPPHNPGSPVACQCTRTPHRPGPTTRRRGGHAVRQTRLRIHADVRLHPNTPLIALLRLVHLRIPRPRAVLRRRRHLDGACVHNRPRLQLMPQRSQVRVDLSKQRLAKTVLLQQVAKVQDRRLVPQRTCFAASR